MDIARQDFLAGAGFAGDHHGGIGAGDLLRQLDDLGHGLVAVDQVTGIVGDGGQHRGDQFRIRRQRDVFFGTGVNRGDCGTGIVGDAAGDDRHVDVFGFQQQVGAFAAAQHRHRLVEVLGVDDGGAVVHGDLGGGGQLTLECPDDEKPHGLLLLLWSAPFGAGLLKWR